MATQGNWKSRFDPEATQPGAYPPTPQEHSMDALIGALKSRTNWILGFPLTLLGFIDILLKFTSDNPAVTTIVSKMFPFLGPLLALLGAMAIFLRAITTKPLAEKAG